MSESGVAVAERATGVEAGGRAESTKVRAGSPFAGLWSVLTRELSGYFATPLGYVFICVFLILAGVFSFQVYNFFEVGQADLRGFFQFHPWLYLFLIPAVSMRMWSEERRSGTLELLMTLPVSTLGAVLGKFLAAWIFAALALALTFPMWITVSVLGDPDHGVILAGYAGSLLMAGAYIAVGSCISSMTRSQTIAFVVSGLMLFTLTMAGFGPVQEWLKVLPGDAGIAIAGAVSQLSTLQRFEAVSQGVLSLQDVAYFLTLGATAVGVNLVVIEASRSR